MCRRPHPVNENHPGPLRASRQARLHTEEKSTAMKYNSQLQPNPDHPEEIRRAVEIMVGSGPTELRALKLDGKENCTASGWYDDLDKLAADAARLNLRTGYVYIVPNPINPDLLARRCNRFEVGVRDLTADHHVTSRRWFLIDFDPVRLPGISATAEEKADACRRA